MLNEEAITKYTASPLILDFWAFVVGETGERPFPDYLTMDLMMVPHLVPKIFVVEVAPSDGKRLLFKFAGSHFDAIHQQNVMGKYLEDFYDGENKELVLQNNNEVIDRKRPYYFHNQTIFHKDGYDNRKTIERLAFPCSSNGTDINFTIGLVDFKNYDDGGKDVVVML